MPERNRRMTSASRSSIRIGPRRPPRAAALCSPALVSSTANSVGRYRSTTVAGMRPRPDIELAAYGGASVFRGRRVLDLGTGDGRLALGAVRWAREVVGLDPDPAAIRSARANARRMGARDARFRVGAAQRLPFPDGSFDIVILSWAL